MLPGEYTRRRTFFCPSLSVQNDLSSIAAAEVAADTYQYFAVLRVVEAGSDLGLFTAGTSVTSIYVQRKVRPTIFEYVTYLVIGCRPLTLFCPPSSGWVLTRVCCIFDDGGAQKI